jgi:hypothetical protein
MLFFWVGTEWRRAGSPRIGAVFPYEERWQDAEKEPAERVHRSAAGGDDARDIPGSDKPETA